MSIKANASPCVKCPWRPSNQGTRSAGGWYSKANLRRLWVGMRRGEQMTCHPTDPRMAEMAEDGPRGFRPAPEGADVRECAGSIILKLREMYYIQERYGTDFRKYAKARPKGLTKFGVAAIIERVLFGQWKTSDFDLNEPDVGHPDLDWEGAR